MKVREYKDRIRAERDLRIVNERSLMEEVERYKKQIKKEQRDRNISEQRYIDIIANLKTKLSVRNLSSYQFLSHHLSKT